MSPIIPPERPTAPGRPGDASDASAGSRPRERSEPHSDTFDQALRRWATRPPRTPAAAAARRIESRLPETRSLGDRSIARRPLLALAAAAIVAIGLALILTWAGLYHPVDSSRGTTGTAAVPPSPAEAAATPAPSDDLLVIDLDERTTLYLDLS